MNWAWHQTVIAVGLVLYWAYYFIEILVTFLNWLDRRRWKRDCRTYNEFMSLWGRPW